MMNSSLVKSFQMFAQKKKKKKTGGRHEMTRVNSQPETM